MAVAGALIGMALNSFGRKPVIPDLPQINPAQVQAEAIAANQAALPAAQQLATGVNTFNVQQRLSMLQQALGAVAPGSLEKVGANINSQLRGEINPDVASQI